MFPNSCRFCDGFYSKVCHMCRTSFPRKNYFAGDLHHHLVSSISKSYQDWATPSLIFQFLASFHLLPLAILHFHLWSLHPELQYPPKSSNFWKSEMAQLLFSNWQLTWYLDLRLWPGCFGDFSNSCSKSDWIWVAHFNFCCQKTVFSAISLSFCWTACFWNLSFRRKNFYLGFLSFLAQNYS